MAPSPTTPPGQRSALIVANLIRLGGLTLGINAGLRAAPDPRVIALAAFMLAGAQVSRATIMELVSRFFGLSSKDDHE
jgi:hypothetical protein